MIDQRNDTRTMRDRIEELAERFLKRCVHDLVLLHRFLDGMRTGNAVMLAEIAHLAHKIRGTGGSLGFSALSECAAELERIAEPADFAGGTLDAQLFEQLARSALRLEGELDQLLAKRSLAQETGA